MKRVFTAAAFAGAVLFGSTVLAAPFASADSTSAVTVIQQRSFGTITRGARICVGPIAPTSADGVQIFGFTNANTNLTWQVLTVSSQSAETVVFQTVARSVSQTVKPSGNLLFEACVLKSTAGSQDYDISINSQPVG
ncbi:hypothetical protein [Virgisporangium aurantiacum]|uniref:Secreted protein n=1 Tax=Virgisporangium aurantiacum TaxID=175570 RepID=A0A8J4E5X5_9ACTN|nr:hypothetical protein [Virgisporangium aurantiacum]GIJ62801.1 hypothetical protein Vau01_103170 [Virgisporangium aurantiacum]